MARIPRVMETFLVNKEVQLEMILEDFRVSINAGLDPNMCTQSILARHGLTEDDITGDYRRRLIRRVETMYKNKQSRGYA